MPVGLDPGGSLAPASGRCSVVGLAQHRGEIGRRCRDRGVDLDAEGGLDRFEVLADCLLGGRLVMEGGGTGVGSIELDLNPGAALACRMD